MNLERSFGASPVRVDNPYNLEGYGNESVKEFTEINSVLDRIASEGLGLPADCPAEGRIWQFKKDPWQFYSESGHLLYTLENIRFTATRAEDCHDTLRCNMIVRLDWTTHEASAGEREDSEIPMLITVTDAAHDELLSWDIGTLRDFRGWIKRPISFMQDFSPHLYEDISGINWYVFLFKGRLYEC